MKPLKSGHIIFTPEGTRSLVDKWKSGFYHIAHNSHLPISIAYIDYKKKNIGVDNILYPTGDIVSDCDIIRNTYKRVYVYFIEAEKKFKIIALRNKYLGLWAAEKLSIKIEERENYAKEVILADFKEVGDQDVIDKILQDFQLNNISIDQEVIKQKMVYFFNDALKKYDNIP